MSEAGPQLIRGHCVWDAAEVVQATRWLKPMPAQLLAQIDVAVNAWRLPDWRHVTRQNFRLEGSESFFNEVREELENGTGMVQITGLDVSRYRMDQLRCIWYALGCYLGTPMYQNRRGEAMRDIEDEGTVGVSLYGETVDTKGKKFLSSGARTLSPGKLRFHTDRCDVVGLLCVRQAAEGGVSKLASSATVYNDILVNHPDLHALLCAPIPRSRFGEESGGEFISYDLPVFGVRDGKLTSHFSLTYVENAQLMDGVRKLSAPELDAIRLLMETAEKHSFSMTFKPGDIQLLNNHVIYHARTEFRDDAAAGKKRLLMRLWLSMPNSRALPASHAVLWGNVEAGQPRGGIAQPSVVASVA
ncbi:hypothetical protein CDEF62S_04309 [Castellaniella defragrans]